MAKPSNTSIWRIPAVAVIATVIAALAYVSFISGPQGAGGNVMTINGITYAVGNSHPYYQGQRVSNFLIQYINQDNVTGLSYIEYPLAMRNGTPRTLHVGDTVGYSCDNSTMMLTAINNGSAAFANLSSGAARGGCPI
ncbi:MAG TPA: hypothetical protein VMV00_01825 [Candidatus Baltobacteraceae bacterium]|nr:hypothetical protein [Candidatus Baltobacteraceae bacterium]